MEHITESINGIAIIDNARYEGLIIFDEYRIIFRGEQYQCAVAFDWSSAKCSVDEETISRFGLIKRKQARYHLYDQQGHWFDFVDTSSEFDASTKWIRDLFKNNKKHAVERNHTAQIQEEQRQEIARLVREKEEAEARRIAEENRIKEVQEAETARLNEIREAKIREEMELQELEKENKAREEELQRQAEALRISEENKFKEAQEAEKERLNEIREAKIREEMQLQKLEEQKKALEEQAEQRRKEEEQREKERQEAELQRLEEDRKIKEQQLAEMERLNAIRAEIEQAEAQKAEEERKERERQEKLERIEREKKAEEERIAKEREEEERRREEARLAKIREEEEERRREEEKKELERQAELKRQKELQLAKEREEIKRRRHEEDLRAEERKRKKELQKKLKESEHNLDNRLFQEEEALKEYFYKKLGENVRDAEKRVDELRYKVAHGNFATGTKQMTQQDLNAAMDTLREYEKLQKVLSNNPYFSHMEAIPDEDGKEDYFLSDNENLDEYVPLGENRYLLPFKKDSERPIISAIRRCHFDQNGKPVTYESEDGEHTITPQLIRDTKIEKKKLLEVIQLYPTPEEHHIESDELLADRLEENRNNPTLSNIISTLQMQQFEIIETDVKKSFVVQGCAGSGKSQCLIHRLFFLREELSESGWDKVLMITPTKLFRHYSRNLMKRYQLSDIYDCSISDLYIELLNAYDKRFRERQYKFELTEEYLPDDYLYEIYAEENVKKVESEIENAILKYVSQACKYLNEEVPERISIDEVNGLIERLTTLISEINSSNKSYVDDEKYQEYRKRKSEYDSCVSEVQTLVKEQAKCKEELEEIIEEKEQCYRTIQEITKFREQKTVDIIANTQEIQDLFTKYESAKEASDRNNELVIMEALKDLVTGQDRDSNEKSMDDLIRAMREYDIRCAKLEEQIDNILESILEKAETIEQFLNWAKDNPYDGEKTWSDNEKERANISQIRYYLSRIESTVFEQEVWNAMAPIKKRYDIQTLDIEMLGEDKRKETRILYKSDLLFYVMIYNKLYPKAKLPDYRLICVDEAQDLHRADYETLRKLYPKAVFNVFGDVNQVLHTSAGISEWEEQTGISTIYPLMTNYRNTAAIVDFCNEHFDVNMDYVGDPEDYYKPIEVSDPELAKDILEEEEPVIIVKDRESYIELCDEMGVIPEDYVFLDTTSEKNQEDDKECYSIFAAKGLEFRNVFVFANGMTKNQRVVACTRAMNKLYYYGGESV